MTRVGGGGGRRRVAPSAGVHMAEPHHRVHDTLRGSDGFAEIPMLRQADETAIDLEHA